MLAGGKAEDQMTEVTVKEGYFNRLSQFLRQ